MLPSMKIARTGLGVAALDGLSVCLYLCLGPWMVCCLCVTAPVCARSMSLHHRRKLCNALTREAQAGLLYAVGGRGETGVRLRSTGNAHTHMLSALPSPQCLQHQHVIVGSMSLVVSCLCGPALV